MSLQHLRCNSDHRNGTGDEAKLTGVTSGELSSGPPVGGQRNRHCETRTREWGNSTTWSPHACSASCPRGHRRSPTHPIPTCGAGRFAPANHAQICRIVCDFVGISATTSLRTDHTFWDSEAIAERNSLSRWANEGWAALLRRVRQAALGGNRAPAPRTIGENAPGGNERLLVVAAHWARGQKLARLLPVGRERHRCLMQPWGQPGEVEVARLPTVR